MASTDMASTDPTDERAALEAAVRAHGAGDPAAMQKALHLALALNPAGFDGCHLVGIAIYQGRSKHHGLRWLRRASIVRPDIATLHRNIGIAALMAGDAEQAVAAFDDAARTAPDDFSARLYRCVARIPVVYRNAEEIAASRAAYRADLNALLAETAGDPVEVLAAKGAAAVGPSPFFLAYQGLCDRDEQTRFGTLIHRLLAARFPACAARPPVPPPTADGKLRIGILSAFFTDHSNWKMRIRGWLETLDRSRFEVYGYYPRTVRTGETLQAAALCTRFVEGALPLERWVEEIRANRLHVLILPEIGMDATVAALAALWLAPVQMTSWGHPDTSGLPTVDYYLSSDPMEPEEAQAHYSETLVRLPNLSCRYEPETVVPATLTRADIGVRPDAALYWCCQSFPKYLPQFDELAVRIARRVPQARFVFIQSYYGPEVDAILRERMQTAFTAAGLSYRDHVVVLPHLSKDRFHAVAAMADVGLDTPLWSGCNTTLETLAHGVPVVTLPGDLMRGRHTLGILRTIGVTETVATTPDDYVDIACRLVEDRPWRQRISAAIAANLGRAYGDATAVRALEDLMAAAVAARRGRSGPGD